MDREELERLSWSTAPSDEQIQGIIDRMGLVDRMPPHIRAVCHEHGYAAAMAAFREFVRRGGMKKRPRTAGPRPWYVAPKIDAV